MVIHKEFLGGFPKLSIAGHPNLYTVGQLDFYIRDHFQIGAGRYYIDLSDVNYLDSMTLGYLVSLHIQFKEVGDQLVFLNPGPEIEDILAQTNVSKILHIEGA